MLNFLVWIIVGALVGWIASLIMRTGSSLWVDIVVGLVGGFLGGLLAGPLFGTGPVYTTVFSWSAFVASIIGAVILLAILRLVRTGAAPA